MTRRLLSRLVLPVALLAAAAGGAHAQTYIGAGSTVEGDISRGYGVLYDGLGRYNLNSAIGRSIDVDTTIKWNEYVYNCIKNANRESAERRAADSARNKTNYAAIQRRLKENPTESDLMNGDALNIVMEELLDPKVDPTVLRMAKVPLPGATIRMLPFQYAQLGGIISMRQLTVRDGWPLALRGEAFNADRKAYLNAVDVVLEQDLKNKLTLEAVEAVQSAVKRFQNKVETTIPESKGKPYFDAKAFLRDLAKAADLLQTPLVGDVLASIEKYPGTSVAELLGFMQRYNLRFSPAAVPAEREIYKSLYPALVRQREALAMQVSGKVAGDVPPDDKP